MWMKIKADKRTVAVVWADKELDVVAEDNNNGVKTGKVVCKYRVKKGQIK